MECVNNLPRRTQGVAFENANDCGAESHRLHCTVWAAPLPEQFAILRFIKVFFPPVTVVHRLAQPVRQRVHCFDLDDVTGAPYMLGPKPRRRSSVRDSTWHVPHHTDLDEGRTAVDARAVLVELLARLSLPVEDGGGQQVSCRCWVRHGQLESPKHKTEKVASQAKKPHGLRHPLVLWRYYRKTKIMALS